MVGEIKTVVDQIVDKSQEYRPPQKRPKTVNKDSEKYREYKVVGDTPPKMPDVKLNMSYCPMQMDVAPKTDIQV